MPYKIELTWHEARACWKRMYRGRTYYMGKGKCRGRSDMDGYRAAWAEWEQRKREADDHSNWQRQGQAVAGDAPMRAEAFATDYRAVGFSPAIARSGTVAETRIDSLIEVFIAQKRSSAETGEISPKMYAQYRSKLDDFGQFAKDHGKLNAAEIDSNLLGAYRETQLHLTVREDEHAISPHTAKKRLVAVQQFMTWLFEHEVIDRVPRNLNRQYARIKMPKPSPAFFTVDEVRAMFNAASQRTKLYIALGLNCGYTQKDIATLEHGMVHWATGEIRRERHKTHVSHVHRLWAVTMELLKKEMTAGESGLMLLDENGNSLVRERIGDRGQLVTNDVIKLAFNRVMAKLGMSKDRRRFRIMRKTSSNEIERAFPAYPHLSSQFLAHGEQATKRYYVAQHYELLFQAIDWLAGFYNLSLDTKHDPIASPLPVVAP